MAQIRPIEEKVQFQGSAKGGSFDPYNVADPNAGLQGKLSSINQSFDLMEKGSLANYDQEGRNIRELAKFSDTLSESLQQGTKFYAKYEEEQADMLFAEDQLAQAQAAEELTSQEAVLAETDKLHQQQASSLIKQGAPIEVVERMKELGGLRGYYYKRNAAKMAGEQFETWATSKFLNDTTEVTLDGVTKPINSKDWQPHHQAGIMKILLGQYYKESGLDQVSRGLQAKYALPKITEAQSKLMGVFRKEYGIKKSALQVDELKANFASDYDLAKLLGGLANTFDERGNARGYAGAWKAGLEHIKDMFDAGMIKEDQLQAIEGQIDPESGKTFGQRWPVRFKLLREELAAENRKNWDADQAAIEQQFKEEEDGLREFFSTNKPTEQDVEAAEKDLFNKYGKTSEFLSKLKSTYTIDAEQKERLNDQFTKLAEQGLLTPEMVQRAPWEVQSKWATIAQKQAEATDMSSAFKTQLKAIENQVKSDPRVKVSPDGSTSGMATLVVGELQAKFRRKVAEYVGTGLSAQAAANQAVLEVFNEFSTSSKYQVNDTGEFANFMPKGTAASSKALNNKLNNIRKKISNGGKAALDVTPGLMFNKAELLAIEKGYGQPGWSVPPVAAYWASQLNMNPLDIINRQRTAAGLKPLATPASIERVQGTISPALQALLNRYQSPNRSIRGLTGMGRFDPVMIPKGYGTTVQKAAQANGIDPSILAGLLETENGWKATGTSRSGARGIAQIMPQYHPGVNPDDPIASINYAAKYLSQLQRQFGGDMRLALIAYNAGPGNVEKYRGPIPGDQESGSYYGKVMKAAGKYGYGMAWNSPSTMRGKFRAIEYLSGDPAHKSSYRADHSGDNYHDHIAFATTAERNAAIKKLQAAGIQVGSVDRPGDPGNHGRGLAIDIPASQVPVGKEKELSRRVRSILGLS